MKLKFLSGHQIKVKEKNSSDSVVSKLNVSDSPLHAKFTESKTQNRSTIRKFSSNSKNSKLSNFSLDKKAKPQILHTLGFDETFRSSSNNKYNNIQAKFTKFKPSIFTRNILKSIIPTKKESVYEKKKRDLHLSLSSKTIFNKLNYKIEEEQEQEYEPVTCQTETSCNMYLKTECSHYNEDSKYINKFLTPINRFIAKEFKINNNDLPSLPNFYKLPPKVPKSRKNYYKLLSSQYINKE